MKKLACLVFVGLWFGAAVALAQQQPRYPVDPDTKWATGATQKPADELKKQLAAGTEVLIIDVRAPASFEKETLPGAINIPLDQLAAYLPTIPKDKTLVFTWSTGGLSSQAAKLAQENGFKSATFCPINKWKEEGNETQHGNKAS